MKLMDVDELFNKRVIIIELEACFNDDYAIEAPWITKVKKKHQLLQKYSKKEDIPVGGVGE